MGNPQGLHRETLEITIGDPEHIFKKVHVDGELFAPNLAVDADGHATIFRNLTTAERLVVNFAREITLLW